MDSTPEAYFTLSVVSFTAIFMGLQYLLDTQQDLEKCLAAFNDVDPDIPDLDSEYTTLYKKLIGQAHEMISEDLREYNEMLKSNPSDCEFFLTLMINSKNRILEHMRLTAQMLVYPEDRRHLAARRNGEKKNRERNALRVSCLSKPQLDYLNARIMRNLEVTETGCWRSDLPLVKKSEKVTPTCKTHGLGYPKSLYLNKAEMARPGDYIGVPPGFNWVPAQVMLVCRDSHAKNRYQESSHLCDHGFCVNPDHLIWEDPQQNYWRKNCIPWTTCPCRNSWNPCIHKPQCIPMIGCLDPECHHNTRHK